MACAVYCLVPRPEQLESVLGRLKEAGVATRDISVVLREARGSARARAGYPPGCMETWWAWSLVPWALLWASANARATAPAASAGSGPEVAAEAAHLVIPLAIYRARAGA